MLQTWSFSYRVARSCALGVLLLASACGQKSSDVIGASRDCEPRCGTGYYCLIHSMDGGGPIYSARGQCLPIPDACGLTPTCDCLACTGYSLCGVSSDGEMQVSCGGW